MGIEMNLGSSDNQAHSVSDVFSNRIHSYENIYKNLFISLLILLVYRGMRIQLLETILNMC